MPREPRKVTIADGMLLIVGTSLALASWRFIMAMPVWAGFPDSLQWYHFQGLGSVAFLTPLSLTLLVVALRPPRRALRHVAAEPAVLVGLAALSVAAINTALLLSLMFLVGWTWATFTGGKVLYFCRLISEQTGMAIVAAWSVQAVSGRCRWPKTWIDFAGWILGACWILLAIASAAFTLL